MSISLFLDIFYIIGPSTKLEKISRAVTDIQNGLSYRQAEAKYDITLHLYATGKIEFGSRPGPPSILTTAEEQKLVNYIVEMSRISYGCTKEKVLDYYGPKVCRKGWPKKPFCK